MFKQPLRPVTAVLVVFCSMFFGACADDVRSGTTCNVRSTLEPAGTTNCVMTISSCSDAAQYEIVCTENITIECTCKRNSVQIGNFTSPTLCPWIEQVNDACGWDLVVN
mgnify:CR=1 FL=1